MGRSRSNTAPPSGDKEKRNPYFSEIKGLALLLFAIIQVLSLLSFAYGMPSKNWLGLFGYCIAWIFHLFFGLTSYLVCAFIGWTGWRLLFSKSLNQLKAKIMYFGVIVVSICLLLCLLEDKYPLVNNYLNSSIYSSFNHKAMRYHTGGAPFYFIYRDLPGLNLQTIFNTTGIAIVSITALAISILFLFRMGFLQLMTFFKNWLTRPPTEKQEPTPTPQSNESPENGGSDFLRYVKLRIPGASPQFNQESPPHLSAMQDVLAIQPETHLTVRPSLSRKESVDSQPPFMPTHQNSSLNKTGAKENGKELPKPNLKTENVLSKREAALKAQSVHNGDFTNYQLPPLSLLTNAKKIDHSNLKKDLRKQAEVLEETLLSFGIEAKVGQINCGPTITSFEVHPAIGVKVQKIKTLENDIALNMEAKSIRIIAPIPGKAAVGIEVPNAQPQEVGFKDMLHSYQQSSHKFHIPVLLGKTVNGDYVMSDLTKMPHCIIAGATGSGKSVCINTIVMSILYNARPDQIKLVMVDPKKVELTPYTALPHMIAPVITEPQGACAALQWMVKEMESRYEILKQLGVRNIEAFNNRKIDKNFEASLNREIPEKMYYLVGIIDELADLMMVASSDIETPIARIAQMARAVGIHLILATQRPSREVITGLIKANFPTRVSFKVASRVNSQIVLDETGAETLLGNGDMLFLPPGSSHLVRAQGAFIRDDDINASIKFINNQAPPHYLIPSFDNVGTLEDKMLENNAEKPADALYGQALDIVLGTGNASTTFLQRKLKIGYARAASLIDLLESQGIVGPTEGSKPRKILVVRPSEKSEEDEELDEDEEA